MMLAAVLVVGFLYVFQQIGAPTAHEIEVLRSQFRLPDDVALDDVRVNRKTRPANPPRIEGIATFTEPQLRAYLASFGDAVTWRPRPIDYDGQVFSGPYATDALDWQPLDRQAWKGWGSLSARATEDVRKGHQLCYEVRPAAADGTIRGTRCSPPPGPEAPVVFVQGLLDEETRTLHMMVWGVRAAAGHSH